MYLFNEISNKELIIYNCKFVKDVSNYTFRCLNDLYALQKDKIYKISSYEPHSLCMDKGRLLAGDFTYTGNYDKFYSFSKYSINFDASIFDDESKDPYCLYGVNMSNFNFYEEVEYRIISKEKYNKIKDIL